MSVAGGLPRAVERAVVHGCGALQVFTKNANRWRGRPLPADEIRAFRQAVDESGITPVVSHASYLINLASTDPQLRQQSLTAMTDEIDRAESLGLLGVVLHPGCYTSGETAAGLALVGEALRAVLSERRPGRTMVLLEQTAGQGTALGWRFEELATILAHVDGHPRVGICLDTCHLLAAGYDLATEAGYARTIDEFARTIGFDCLKVIHLNDSKKPLGSRIDRHEHIGKGHVGIEGFCRLVNDRRLRHLPMVLETPKAEGKATGPIRPDPLDMANLTLLRGLVTPH